MLKVLAELDVTKIILHNTMECLLEQGEKLDDLVSKPKALRTPSKARKQRGNRTCAVKTACGSPCAEMSRSFTSELQPLGKQIHRGETCVGSLSIFTLELPGGTEQSWKGPGAGEHANLYV